MANRIKGISIEIDGNTKKLDQALANTDKELRVVQADLRAVERGLKMDPGNAELLAQKQRLLGEAAQGNRKRFQELQDAAEGMNKALAEGKISEAQYKAFNLELDLTRSAYESAEKAAKGFNSSAAQIEDTAKKMESGGGRIVSVANSIAGALGTAAKAGAVAIGAASAAVGALVKTSVEEYADYEQLIGGVETLFKSSSDIVENYAQNAYKTAGLSANEYMDTVTSFSASLLQGLGGNTQKAAELADLAITDMADNANKMGTDMESIQNAYQGFAKQNYTMLDNLKLGYGGTQEEMIRLINDSGILNETIEDLDDISFDQIIQAIHEVQTNMGITGTTALEASTTIQGSLSSAQAAWKNLVTGLADENANLDFLIGNFVDSVLTVADNIMPVVQQVMSGIGELISGLAPLLAKELPKLILDLLPSLLNAGAQLVSGLLEGIINGIPNLVSTLGELLPAILGTFKSILPRMAELGRELLTLLQDAILNGIPALATAAVELSGSIADGLEEGVPQAIQGIISFLFRLVTTMLESLPQFVEAGITILSGLLQGFMDYLPTLLEWIPFLIIQLTESLAENLPQIVEMGVAFIGMLVQGLIEAIPLIIEALPEIIAAIGEGILNLGPALIEIGASIINGITQGIQNAAESLGDWIMDFFSGIVDGVKNLLGIHSPSRVFAGIGENMALGLGEGWSDEFSRIQRSIQDGMNFGSVNMSLLPPPNHQAVQQEIKYIGTEPNGYAGKSSPTSSAPANLSATVVLDGVVVGRLLVPYIDGYKSLRGANLVLE